MSDHYQKLLVWQKAMDLSEQVYRVTEDFPARERYGLASQLRSSALSVPSNIAEGHGRVTRGERRQFLGHARGSILELQTQLILAGRLRLITGDDLIQQANEIGRMLNGLLRSTNN